jgi:hypothetical protein
VEAAIGEEGGINSARYVLAWGMERKRLPAETVADITRSAILSVLPKARIARIEVNRQGLTFPAELGIAVIFRGKGFVRLSGKRLVEIERAIGDELFKNGDERFAYMRYLTAEEAKDLVA